MKRVMSRLTVFAVLLGLVGPTMAHRCGERIHKYLRGHYHGECEEKTELPHGQGEARGADKYVGEWVKGKPNGKGVYTWENGARYEGEFKNGKVDGKGLYTSSNGVSYEGGFVEGKLKELGKPDCPATPGPLSC